MWKQAALTPFVIREGVGFAVESLKEIEACLKSITPQQYSEMCDKAKVISKRLAEGYYFKAAFRKALELL